MMEQVGVRQLLQTRLVGGGGGGLFFMYNPNPKTNHIKTPWSLCIHDVAEEKVGFRAVSGGSQEEFAKKTRGNNTTEFAQGG